MAFVATYLITLNSTFITGKQLDESSEGSIVCLLVLMQLLNVLATDNELTLYQIYIYIYLGYFFIHYIIPVPFPQSPSQNEMSYFCCKKMENLHLTHSS